jgi:2-methylisocitrate lyase-like PEP mutase family enzyme
MHVTNTEDRAALANRFRELHRGGELLLLPNVWDAVSAKLYEEEGFAAVGTTSAGIAATQGFPDGEKMSVEDTARVVRTIVRHVRIPVSADIEGGYSRSTEGVVESARVVMEAGAAGINLEDGQPGQGGEPSGRLLPSELQCERIRAVREMTTAVGCPLVINARTDVYLVPEEPARGRLAEAIRRGNLYFDAGADCVFVPDLGNLSMRAIENLVTGLGGPLNIIAGEQTPPVGELRRLGVARLSFGPRPMRRALSLLQEMAREWVREGTYGRMSGGELTYAKINAWFESS